MNTGGPPLLCQSDDGIGNVPSDVLRLPAHRHCEIGIFVDHYNQVWEEAVTVNGRKLSVFVFVVVEFDVVDVSLVQQGVPIVHFHTEGAEDLVRLVGVFDDGSVYLGLFVLRVRKDGEIVPDQILVGSELDHLRVDEHELEFGGVLGIQQRGHDHVQPHGFALSCRAGDEQMRRIRQIEDFDFLGDGVADGDRKFRLAFPVGRVVQDRLEGHHGRLVVGDFDADRISKGDNSHALGMQIDTDVIL